MIGMDYQQARHIAFADFLTRGTHQAFGTLCCCPVLNGGILCMQIAPEVVGFRACQTFVQIRRAGITPRVQIVAVPGAKREAVRVLVVRRRVAAAAGSKSAGTVRPTGDGACGRQ